ncbi:MAG: cyclic nucleotide-binding domain-containing protein [Betaproteobacteria bacterium]|nr:cyclic nucleotide-binding domain-containing protein [Betaproteobacteria bacterium]
MSAIRKIAVTTGMFWVEVPEAGLRILCGCPVDAVKHLLRRGLIVRTEVSGVECETGPNAILLSDLPIQNGWPSNHAEFPLLQILYKQGMIVPGHPGNTGARPLLVGSRSQVNAQMEYLFRGNYGLSSKEELTEAGVPSYMADELMRMKLAFAFGRIMPTEELCRPVYVEREPHEVLNGVTIRRLRTNVFELAYRGEKVEIDLNLGADESFECPYTLDNHFLKRDYFAVVHTGDGDGWDMNRPPMGSIVLFQGRVYLVDAGPNIEYALTALGIGVNEIDGIFHSHGHDDHLAGLTALIRGDRRIAYYAVPMVRVSVFKKLSKLMRIPETEFSQLFDVRDLALDHWNDIEGLEVKPILSPHPVETTIFQFRVMWEGGYRSYAHLADITSAEVLKKMVTDDPDKPGISQALHDRVVAAYAEPADIKKIDIGGGMIHGEARDFTWDMSKKLILAHTARKLTDDERAIGSGAPFGTIDVLIEGVSEPLRSQAFLYLSEYFPEAPLHRIKHLMNGNILSFNPEVLLYKSGQPLDAVFLIVSGLAELLRPGRSVSSLVSSGSILGEAPALLGSVPEETCRAISFVQVLRMHRDLYLDFVADRVKHQELVDSQQHLEFFRRSWLFADNVSGVTLHRLLRAAESITFKAGEVTTPPADWLMLMRTGSGMLTTPSDYAEPLIPGSHFGGTQLSGFSAATASIRFDADTEVCRLPMSAIADIPVVRWKLHETHRRRYIDN